MNNQVGIGVDSNAIMAGAQQQQQPQGLTNEEVAAVGDLLAQNGVPEELDEAILTELNRIKMSGGPVDANTVMQVASAVVQQAQQQQQPQQQQNPYAMNSPVTQASGEVAVKTLMS